MSGNINLKASEIFADSEPLKRIMIAQLDGLMQELEWNAADQERYARYVEIAIASMMIRPTDRDTATDGIRGVLQQASSKVLANGAREALMRRGREIARAIGEVPREPSRFARRLAASKLYPALPDLLRVSRAQHEADLYDHSVKLAHFAAAWAGHGCNVFAPSPGLAVGLALTDAIRGPWPPLPFDAFWIELPPGVVPFALFGKREAWATSVMVQRVALSGGDGVRLRVDHRGVCCAGQGYASADHVEDLATEDHVLINGDALALRAAERVARNLCHWLEAARSTRREVEGAPSLVEPPATAEGKVRRWDLGREVPLRPELREAAADLALGRSRAARHGWKLRCRHVVRGHWRNQAHGPGRQEHTRRWIEPHWRGPDGTEVWQHIYVDREKNR